MAALDSKDQWFHSCSGDRDAMDSHQHLDIFSGGNRILMVYFNSFHLGSFVYILYHTFIPFLSLH